MDTTQIGISYNAILPEAITASVAVLIMMIDALGRKIERRVAGVVSLLGLIAAARQIVHAAGQDGAGERTRSAEPFAMPVV